MQFVIEKKLLKFATQREKTLVKVCNISVVLAIIIYSSTFIMTFWQWYNGELNLFLTFLDGINPMVEAAVIYIFVGTLAGLIIGVLANRSVQMKRNLLKRENQYFENFKDSLDEMMSLELNNTTVFFLGRLVNPKTSENPLKELLKFNANDQTSPATENTVKEILSDIKKLNETGHSVFVNMITNYLLFHSYNLSISDGNIFRTGSYLKIGALRYGNRSITLPQINAQAFQRGEEPNKMLKEMLGVLVDTVGARSLQSNTRNLSEVKKKAIRNELGQQPENIININKKEPAAKQIN